MGATTVTGTILGVDNAPRVGVYVTFRLKSTGTDAAATSTIDATQISTVTDANGQFSKTLWDNGDSGVTSVMEIRMPSGQRHDVIIPAADAAIDVWDLIENYTVGTADPQLPTNEALFLKVASNLSDVASPSTSRTNLGVAIGADVQAHSAVLDATTASFLIADETKLDGIEALADVTDTANVTAAGALMESGLASVAAVKATTASFTAADETKLDNSYSIGGTDVALADGGTGASTASAARTNLGLVIGTNVQAYDAQLTDIAGLTPTDSTIIVGNGTNFVSESGATARTSLGLGSADAVAHGSLTLSTDLAIADGGTGASDAATARANLGIGSAGTAPSSDYATAAQGVLADSALQSSDIGLTVQAQSAVLDATTASYTTAEQTKLSGIEALADVTDATNVVAAGGYIAGGTDVAIADGGTGASTEALARTNLEFQTNVTGDVTAVGVTSYTVLTTDHTLTVNDTTIGGNVTINLPAVATVGSGFMLNVAKKGTSFNVTVDGSGTETINGALSYVMSNLNATVTIVSTATGWEIISEFRGSSSDTTTVTTTTYTTLVTDSVILVDDDTAGAAVTITLISAVTAGNGFPLTIKKLGSTGDVIIDADGAETIDDSLTNTIKLHHDWRKLVSDGANWKVIG